MHGSARELDCDTHYDRLALIAERSERPLDFAVVLHLEDAERDPERLRSAANSAYLTFPKTAARLEGRKWFSAEAPVLKIESRPDDAELRARIEAAVEVPLDPRYAAPLEEIIYRRGERTTLLIRCHHAAADLTSVLWWADHQLRAARKETPRAGEESARSPLALRTSRAARGKSRFAFDGPSRELWRRRSDPSRARRFTTFEIDADRWRTAIGGRIARGFSYNDLLTAAVIAAARAYQEVRGAPSDRLALWFPIDVRSKAFAGFGNGTRPIRIYDRAPATASATDIAFLVREELEAARSSGEWSNAIDRPWLRFPDALVRTVLRSARMEWGSLPFTHVERITPDRNAAVLPGVRAIEVISVLERRHPLGIAAVTLGSKTRVTLTWDPAQIDESDARGFSDQISSVLRRAEETLPPKAG